MYWSACVGVLERFINNVTVTCLLPEQIIQRQLEQVEEKQRQLEERGVAVEKALRGEAGNILSHIHPVWCTSSTTSSRYGANIQAFPKGVLSFITNINLLMLSFYSEGTHLRHLDVSL